MDEGLLTGMEGDGLDEIGGAGPSADLGSAGESEFDDDPGFAGDAAADPESGGIGMDGEAGDLGEIDGDGLGWQGFD